MPSRLLYFLTASILVFAAACGSGGGKEQTPAASPTPAVQKVDLSKDDLGRAVNLPPSPKRIVAMSPSIVELMYAVGATPVGRPSSADFPEAAKTVPDFGTAYTPNLEVIASMKPDLIIADAIIDRPTIDSLAALGAPVFAVRVASFDDVVRGLRVVGALSGNQTAAEPAAAKLESKMASIEARLPATGPSVLVLVNLGPGQFVAGLSDSYLGDILKRLKARNLASGAENFRFPGFTDYSKERILEQNPDVILAVSIGGSQGTPSTSSQVKSDPALATMSAVKSGRVYDIDPFVYVQSAGPRVSQVLDELPGILYPAIFKAN